MNRSEISILLAHRMDALRVQVMHDSIWRAIIVALCISFIVRHSLQQFQVQAYYIANIMTDRITNNY